MSTSSSPRPRRGYRTITADDLEAKLGGPLTLGQVLRDIRTLDLEETQVRFAQRCGLTKQALCDIEHGRRMLSVKAAMAVARALDQPARTFAFYAIRDSARAQMKKAGLVGSVQLDIAI